MGKWIKITLEKLALYKHLSPHKYLLQDFSNRRETRCELQNKCGLLQLIADSSTVILGQQIIN